MSRALCGGFTMIEVVVALVILEMGLVGTVGVLTIAHHKLAAAERLSLATQEAADVADSLISFGAAGPGDLDLGLVRLHWSIDAAGVDLVADESSGAKVLEWWIPMPREGP